MLGLAILLGFNLLGLVLKNMLNVPLPANVIGLILFTVALFLKIVKLEWVEDSAQFLLRHMMLFFAPIIVGTLVFFPLIGQQWLTILISLVGSAAAALMVTGWITTMLSGKEEAAEYESESQPQS